MKYILRTGIQVSVLIASVILVGAGIAGFFKDTKIVDQTTQNELLLKTLSGSTNFTKCKAETYPDPVRHYYESMIDQKYLVTIDEYETIQGVSTKAIYLRIWDDKSDLILMESQDGDERIESGVFIKATEYFKDQITRCSKQ